MQPYTAKLHSWNRLRER